LGAQRPSARGAGKPCCITGVVKGAFITPSDMNAPFTTPALS
jgi:hypothetical protein